MIGATTATTLNFTPKPWQIEGEIEVEPDKPGSGLGSWK